MRTCGRINRGAFWESFNLTIVREWRVYERTRPTQESIISLRNTHPKLPIGFPQKILREQA